MHNELRRLALPSQADAEAQRRFEPTITNHPDLPAINWTAIGQSAPVLLNTPADLPEASAIVITWADAEWAALEHVFCSGNTPITYSKRNTGTWPGWQKYTDGIPKVHSASDWDYWGYYRLVEVNGKNVLLFKSNTHLDYPGQQYLAQLIDILITNVKPVLILSAGTAGGARTVDHIGTVNVVNAGTLYIKDKPESQWPEYTDNWDPNWNLINNVNFNKILFPIPTILADLQSICNQFNAFYHTNCTLDQLNLNNLNMGMAEPSLNNMTGAGTPLLTTSTFVVATSAGNYNTFACVEMDDAVIAMTCKSKGIAFGAVRNISDPAQNAALTQKIQGNWGSAIYDAYGFYTSYNGACAAWAILS